MSEQPMIALSCNNLRVNYGETLALDIETLTATGNVIGIIGHNGSGKSTLIKNILQLHEPRSGVLSCALLGKNNSSHPLSPAKDMAYSPENGAIFTDVTVEEYLRLWCRLKQGNALHYKQAGTTCIERLAITPLLPKLGRELSKGQRRRVQIAVGFLTDPKLFLFDEPFDGLDIAQSSNLATLLREASHSMAIVVSTHRMDIVEQIADTVIVLDSGKVFAHGSVSEVCSTLYQDGASLVDAMTYHLQKSNT